MSEKTFHKDQLDVFGETYSGDDAARIIQSYDIENLLTIVQFVDSDDYFVGLNIAVFRSRKELLSADISNFQQCSSLESAFAAADRFQEKVASVLTNVINMPHRKKAPEEPCLTDVKSTST